METVKTTYRNENVELKMDFSDVEKFLSDNGISLGEGDKVLLCTHTKGSTGQIHRWLCPGVDTLVLRVERPCIVNK